VPDIKVEPEGFLGSMGSNLPASGERIVEEIQEIFKRGWIFIFSVLPGCYLTELDSFSILYNTINNSNVPTSS